MSAPDDLARYAPLWSTDKRAWRLMSDADSAQRKDLVPFHLQSGRVVLLDPPERHQWLVQRMLDAGVPVVTSDDVFGDRTERE